MNMEQTLKLFQSPRKKQPKIALDVSSEERKERDGRENSGWAKNKKHLQTDNIY